MPSSGRLFALAAAASTANAAFQGFNYGATLTTGQVKVQSDYEAEFKAAAALAGTNGAFNSARIYTTIQGGSTSDPIQAIPAAISTKTSLLFGLWASAGADQFNNEIAALQKTIDQYCSQLDGLIAGISVGSEDLYRISPTGILNGENPGAGPDVLAGYIKQVRDTVKGTCFDKAPIGHVDTWTAYANSSNQALIDAVDWLGMDAYAYFEDTKPNAIGQGASLFQAALDATTAASGGKPVWITETGWPVSGKDFGQAVPSTENAETFWNEVGCPRFGNVNIWWYTLLDAAPDTPNPSFGIISSLSSTQPLYDLSCKAASHEVTSAASSSAAPTATSSADSEASSAASSVASSASSVVSSVVSVVSSVSSVVSSQLVSPSVSESASATQPTLTSLPAVSLPVPISVSVPDQSQHNTTVVIPVPTPSHDATITSVVAPTPATSTQGGTTPTTGPSTPSTTSVVPAGGSQVNSIGAAVVAILMAAALL